MRVIRAMFWPIPGTHVWWGSSYWAVPTLGYWMEGQSENFRLDVEDSSHRQIHLDCKQPIGILPWSKTFVKAISGISRVVRSWRKAATHTKVHTFDTDSKTSG